MPVKDSEPDIAASGLPEPLSTRDENSMPVALPSIVAEASHPSEDKLLTQKIFEFKMVVSYVDSKFHLETEPWHPETFHGLKVSRKHNYSVNGQSFKPTHSFILMCDSDKRVVPYMLSHGKYVNAHDKVIPEKEGYLGKGTFGKVKIAERLVFVSEDKMTLKPVAMKVLRNHPKDIELDCLKVMGQYDSCAKNTQNQRTYLAVQLLPGRELQEFDLVKYKFFMKHLSRVRGYHHLVCELWNFSSKYWPHVATGITDKPAVAKQLAEQLSKLHAEGYAHLDLKGENVRYNPETNRATIIDYGLASKIGEQQQGKGTPIYLSPEIAAVVDNLISPSLVSGKEDVYTLGMIFSKEMQLHHDPVYGLEFENLIVRMLQKNPKHRPDMARVAAEINLLIAHQQEESKKIASYSGVLTSADTGSTSIDEELATLTLPRNIKSKSCVVAAEKESETSAVPSRVVGWLAESKGLEISVTRSSESKPSDGSDVEPAMRLNASTGLF